MLRRILSVFVAFLCFGMTGVAFADVVNQLEQAAVYAANGDYEQAEGIYKAIVQGYPGSDDALEAQKRLAFVYFDWGRLREAETALHELVVGFPGDRDILQELVSDYSSHADILKALNQITEECLELQDWQKAKRILQYGLDTWPNSSDALGSWAAMVSLNIALGDDSGAQAALDKILNGFSAHPDKGLAVFEAAEELVNSDKYEKAEQLFQYVIENWLGTDAAMESQVGLARLNAISDAKAGNDAAVDAAIKKLLTEFSGREETAGIVNGIGEQYFMLQKYERAIQLYQYALITWPDSEDAVESQSGVGASHAALGNDAAAEAAIEKLLTEFSGHPELPEAALQIAEPYWDKALREEDESQAKAYFRKAVSIAETVESRIPGYVPDADTCGWTGLCYRRLGDYEKSIQCYQKVVDNYPQSPKAWYGLFMVARNYEHLKESGAISKPQADAKIKAAYQQLLERYPDCRVAGIAQQWLTR